MRSVHSGLLLAGLVAAVVGSGAICETVAGEACGDGYVRPEGNSNGSVGDFGAETEAERFEAFLDALVRLEYESNLLQQDTEDACRAIGVELGVPAADMPEGDVTTTCENVAAQVEADRLALEEAELVLTIDVIPAECSIAADAAVDCYAECDVDVDVEVTPATCTGGTLVVQCEAGCSECHLPAVDIECQGSCEGSCTGSCSGSCTGRCEGTCTGTCDGYCETEGAGGECEGRCEGTCTGECSANCEGTCEGSCSGGCSGECIAEVTAGGCDECYAGCDGEYTPLRCEGGEIDVDASAECEAACNAELSLDAECTPPVVFVSVGGDTAAVAEIAERYVDALEVGLPALLELLEQAYLVLDAAILVAENADGIEAGLSLSARAIACAGLSVIASVEIRASIEVSVNASASVSSSAQVTSEG